MLFLGYKDISYLERKIVKEVLYYKDETDTASC